MPPKLRHFASDESGQALLEYVLLIFMALTVVTGMRVSIKKIVAKIWSMLASRVAAPCAECKPQDDFSL